MLRRNPLLLDEVVVKILCDDVLQFKDILNFERVCKLWREASVSRSVWMNQLIRLDDEHAPDVLPNVDLGLMTTFEIKNVVVRAYRRHLRWKTSPIVTPSAFKKIALYSEDPPTNEDRVEPHGNMYGTMWDTYHLLPGGHHLLVHYDKVVAGPVFNFSIFHVPTGRRIWSYADRLQGCFMSSSCNASQHRSDADIIVITAMTFILTIEDDDDGMDDPESWTVLEGEFFLLVLKLRLSTGECEVILRTSIKQPSDGEAPDDGEDMSPNFHVGSRKILSNGDYVAIEYSREYMLFVDLHTQRYRWVHQGSQGIYVQRILHIDERALLCVADVWNDELLDVPSQILVMSFEKIFCGALKLSRFNVPVHAPPAEFWDVVSSRSYITPEPELLAVLNVRNVKAFWRGEHSTFLTLLVTREERAPRLSTPESKLKRDTTIVRYEWKPEKMTLKLVSLKETGSFKNGIPPYWTDMSQSGRCIATTETQDVLHAYTVDTLERRASDQPPSIDIGISLKSYKHLINIKFDRFSDVAHCLAPDEASVLLYYFD